MENNKELLKQFKEDESIASLNEEIGKVIRSVIMSRLLVLTKENKIFSYEAEEYIRKLGDYAIYCKDDKQEGWKAMIRKIVYASGTGNDQRVLCELEAFERVGTVMKMEHDGCSFDEVHEYFFEHACQPGPDATLFGLKILEFAKDGRKFIMEHYADNMPVKKILLSQCIDGEQR